MKKRESPHIASLYEFFANSADKYPQSTALLSGDISLSYSDLWTQINTGIRALHALKLGGSHRIAVVMPNSLEMAVTSLTVSSAFCCVPLNPNYTAVEFENIFRQLDINALITLEGFFSQAYQVAENLGVKLIEINSSTEDGNFQLRWNKQTVKNNPPRVTAATKSDDISLLLQTSGSTSQPKTVPLSHNNMLASTHKLARSLELNCNDRCLHMLPMFHIGAIVDLLLTPLSVGSSVVIAPSMDAKSIYLLIEKFQPTWYQAVPTMLMDLLSHALPNTNALRFIRSVSAPLSPRLQHQIENHFHCPIIEIYGMTETAGIICSNPLPPAIRKPGSVGLPAGPEIKVIDEHGNPAQTKQKGEVVVRGKSVMRGYLNSIEENHKLFVGDWLRTGDEGFLDEDGYLFLTGRLKEQINRGGEKISPKELDDLVLQLPEVKEAAAFAIAHSTLGEEAALAVVSNPGLQITAEKIKQFLRTRVAYFKIPRTIFFVDKLPRNASGKLQRHRLTETFDQQSSNNSRLSATRPDSQIAKEIAGMWQQALGIQNVMLEDNFFDLGGDSLKAFTFIHQLQEKLENPVHVAALYDSPTLCEFVQFLQQNQTLESQRTTLPPQVQEKLCAFLVGWKGSRKRTDSLIVGHNTIGTKPPLFWSINGFDELSNLAKALGPDQPLYGMRTLYFINEKSDENNQRLAAQYVEEILEIQPQGPYLLGGFCEGAKIAFDIAIQLQAQDKTISLLALQEQIIPQSYTGRVAIFLCDPSRRSPRYFYRQPERGWLKFYHNGFTVHHSPGDHDGFYRHPGFQHFAQLLKQEIARTQNSSPCENPTLSTQMLRENDYRVSIQAKPPAFLTPGQKLHISVCITNNSNETWLASKDSGIFLGNRWLSRKGQLRDGLDGYAELPTALTPGASIELQLLITAPDRKGPRILDIDLIDDGVAWFQDKGSIKNYFKVFVFWGGKLFQRKTGELARHAE